MNPHVSNEEINKKDVNLWLKYVHPKYNLHKKKYEF